MIMQSDHRESWHVRIEREPGDDWPDIEIGYTTRRLMFPARIHADLTRGSDRVRVTVKGLNYLKTGQLGRRDEREHWPENIPWVMAMVREARERLNLGPDATDVPW